MSKSIVPRVLGVRFLNVFEQVFDSAPQETCRVRISSQRPVEAAVYWMRYEPDIFDVFGVPESSASTFKMGRRHRVREAGTGASRGVASAPRI